MLVNGKRPAGRAEVISAVPLVAFLPDDLDLVKRSPSYRREYLDDLSAALWPAAGAEQTVVVNDARGVLRSCLARQQSRHARQKNSTHAGNQALVQEFPACFRAGMTTFLT